MGKLELRLSHEDSNLLWGWHPSEGDRIGLRPDNGALRDREDPVIRDPDEGVQVGLESDEEVATSSITLVLDH